jgi:hypothetical protein
MFFRTSETAISQTATLDNAGEERRGRGARQSTSGSDSAAAIPRRQRVHPVGCSRSYTAQSGYTRSGCGGGQHQDDRQRVTPPGRSNCSRHASTRATWLHHRTGQRRQAGCQSVRSPKATPVSRETGFTPGAGVSVDASSVEVRALRQHVRVSSGQIRKRHSGHRTKDPGAPNGPESLAQRGHSARACLERGRATAKKLAIHATEHGSRGAMTCSTNEGLPQYDISGRQRSRTGQAPTVPSTPSRRKSA